MNDYIKIRLLVVASGNRSSISPFIQEQIVSIITLGLQVDKFLIKGKGLIGYIVNFFKLLKKISQYQPNIIHAHYGFSGLLSVLQFKVPVIITFHGCDVNDKKERFISKLAAFFAKHVIFVEEGMVKKMNYFNKNNYAVIPCGINLNDFLPENKTVVRVRLNWSSEYYHVIFASAFDIPVKNAKLAQMVIDGFNLPIIFHELKNLTRSEVRDYLNAGDFLLLTSIREGSPMVIKEALACNCPIVATDVGDIRKMISNIPGCFITSLDPNDVKEKILEEIKFINSNQRIKGRAQIEKMNLSNNMIVERINEIYQKVLS